MYLDEEIKNIFNKK